MPRALLTDNKIFTAFFKPLFDALNRAVHTRQCNELPDQHWLELGVTRILMESPSGRGFLQQYGPHFQSDVSVGLYFESLKSNRRLLLADEINNHVHRAWFCELPPGRGYWPSPKMGQGFLRCPQFVNSQLPKRNSSCFCSASS